MSKLYFVLMLLVMMLGSSCATRTIYIQQAPPVKRTEIKTKKPRYDAIWISGHWKWSKRKQKYVWRTGRWERKKKNYVWKEGHWKKNIGGWVWISGHWK